jgi:DnaJ-class molecular chaperone
MTALIKNYYEILGIRIDATNAEIKKAYRTLAFCYHPDKNKDPIDNKKFLEVQRAYETLNDAEKRQQHDKAIAGMIVYIKLCDKYKKILSTTCRAFSTQFPSKQKIGDLFDFKNFNITPGMVVDIYDNVFCFIAGHYDDKLIGDVDSPYSYVRYCGQHYKGNDIEQDKKLNTNKRAMECTTDSDKYIFLFEKRGSVRIFIGLYKTDR